jgi:ubiquinone/menaquinone biosynthesis C-methylase UbiE
MTSFYRSQVLPRFIDVACGAKHAEPYRRRVCLGLEGRVLELGFGSGHNTRFYPEAVTAVLAVEPADVAWRLARRRVAEAEVPVERTGLDGQALPLPDDSVDSALSTWTMCTIPDAERALREVRRVLRPGGALHFLEHGLAPDASVQAWQRRLEPVQRRVFGGCHLTRRIPELVESAGLEITSLDTFYQEGSPKFSSAASLGVAVAP